MLVISRSLNGGIIISRSGEIIATLRVLKLHQRRVEIGFEAPREVSIHRAECVERREAEGVPA